MPNLDQISERVPPTTPPKSSSALRDQIAKAKAAKRAAALKGPSAVSSTNDDISIVPSDTFEFGLTDDPFNLQSNQGDSKGLLRKRIVSTSGTVPDFEMQCNAL